MFNALMSYRLCVCVQAMGSVEVKKQMQFPLVASSDIAGDRRTEILDLVIGGIDKHSTDLELAARTIKSILDKQFGQTWHVIIGHGFSFDVTALNNNMLHCYYQGTLGILVYKS